MATIAQMLKCSFFVFTITVASLATPANAHAQYWGQDNFYYVAQGGQYVRTGYYRSFPYGKNVQIYDFYQNGRFVKRTDLSKPGWIYELTAEYNASSSIVGWYAYPANQTPNEANLFFQVKATGQWVTLAQLRAEMARRYGAGLDMYLGGYGSALPGLTGMGTVGGTSSTLRVR